MKHLQTEIHTNKQRQNTQNTVFEYILYMTRSDNITYDSRKFWNISTNIFPKQVRLLIHTYVYHSGCLFQILSTILAADYWITRCLPVHNCPLLATQMVEELRQICKSVSCWLSYYSSNMQKIARIYIHTYLWNCQNCVHAKQTYSAVCISANMSTIPRTWPKHFWFYSNGQQNTSGSILMEVKLFENVRKTHQRQLQRMACALTRETRVAVMCAWLCHPPETLPNIFTGYVKQCCNSFYNTVNCCL